MKSVCLNSLFLIVVVPFLCTGADAADLYVSPTGSDSASGSKKSPLATLTSAKSIAAKFVGKEPVNVHVADGVYYLPETIVFTPEDSGSEQASVVYQAEHEGGAILSGGSKLNLEWMPFRDGILKAQTEPGLVVDQLFVDGANQCMARYPNYDPTKKAEAYQGFAADAFSRERASRWANPAGGYIHAMHRARWGGYHYRITGKGPDGEVTYEGGWQNNRQMGMHKDYRMVENIFEELDAPGEWFHDVKQATLYYMPSPNVDLATAIVEVVRLNHLIEFRGTEAKPVRHITLKGFTIRHAARTFMETKEPLLRSDWTIYRGGSLLLTGTEDVCVRDCEFDQLGGNAIFVSNYNRRVLIHGCHIHDTGASGVCFVGDPDAVRNPLFEYGQKNDLSKIDLTPGPKTNRYPADCAVSDCLIHGIGRVERQPAGVLIEMARRITIRDCSVYDCARSGINIGDGAWGGHLIERCDVFDTVQETHDHGSFNSWGRDRYWRSDQKSSQSAVDNNPELPFLDAIETTILRNNRFRCDHGWDIDLDDGSSNYDIYNNLCLAGGLKLREGFRRRAWNNITLNNGLHPHVWYNESGDEVWGNIFMQAPQAARMPTELAKGKRVDENLYYAHVTEIKDQFSYFGWDVNSIVADPLFVDARSGDFRVEEASPASGIGFKSFPMDQFGVKKDSLKRIAETPKIPLVVVPETLGRLRHDSGKAPTKRPDVWLGAKVESLKEQEFSAFGVSKEDGGVKVTTIPDRGDADRIGLQEGDLIQSISGKRVKNVAELFQAYCGMTESSFDLTVIRNQANVEIHARDVVRVLVETASNASDFQTLVLQTKSSGKVASKHATQNSPISDLTDGQLKNGYGPVFANGVSNGAYRMDLGQSQSVSAITTWSTNRGGNRASQKVTLYGSNAAKDPGWKFADRSNFSPLGTIDTTSLDSKEFVATSLRCAAGETLGTFRWIVWQVSPVTSSSENTAFQELTVE